MSGYRTEEGGRRLVPAALATMIASALLTGGSEISSVNLDRIGTLRIVDDCNFSVEVFPP